jgi:hypothetical protein
MLTCVVHEISNNIEDEENVLKSPFGAMNKLQPKDNASSDSGAVIAVDDQIAQDTRMLDNLSEAGDLVTGMEAGGCESDMFESGYIRSSSCLLLSVDCPKQ